MKNFIKQNWFRIGILVIGVLVVIVLYAMLKPSKQEVLPVATNPISQTIKTQQSDIDLQAKCADYASKYFKDSGYNQTTQRDQINSYTNHWNNKIGKCFILINSTWSTDISKTFTLFKDVTLIDVIEGKLFGEFTSNGQSFLDMQVMGCNTYENGDGLSSGVGQQCKSETEFNSFINPLMTN